MRAHLWRDDELCDKVNMRSTSPGSSDTHHLRELRVKRELGHDGAQRRQVCAFVSSESTLENEGTKRTAFVIESGQIVEQLERSHDRLRCRRIEVVEMNEIIDTELLELENDVGQIGSQNFRVGLLLELCKRGSAPL